MLKPQTWALLPTCLLLDYELNIKIFVFKCFDFDQGQTM